MMVVLLSMPEAPKRCSSLAFGTMSRWIVSHSWVSHAQPTALGMWPSLYALVSTSTSTMRMDGSPRCCAAQSVDTRTSCLINDAASTAMMCLLLFTPPHGSPALECGPRPHTLGGGGGD